LKIAFAFVAAAATSLTPAFFFDKYAHSLPRFFATDVGGVLIALFILASLAAGPAVWWLIMRNTR
jgi:hypothetical protein